MQEPKTQTDTKIASCVSLYPLITKMNYKNHRISKHVTNLKTSLPYPAMWMSKIYGLYAISCGKCIKQIKFLKLVYSSLNFGLFQKKPNRGVWGNGISSGIKETACWNSRDQLKKKWSFLVCWRKTHVECSCILVFDIGISIKFCRISRSESLFSLKFLKGRINGEIFLSEYFMKY